MISADKKAFSENLAELAADAFLRTNFGLELFIGADIETVLAERTAVIYQNSDDPTYAGASIHYRQQTFVVLNTHQDLRARYYSAAHELWHLALGTKWFGTASAMIEAQTALNLFDAERAADHFAAAVMLPRIMVSTTWQKAMQNQKSPEIDAMCAAIVRLANLSAMPYVAVTRRLQELGLLSSDVKLVKWHEKDWLAYLVQANFPPSPLNQPAPFESFNVLADFVEGLVQKKQLTLIEAANLLAHTDPKRANRYLKRRQQLMAQQSGGTVE